MLRFSSRNVFFNYQRRSLRGFTIATEARTRQDLVPVKKEKEHSENLRSAFHSQNSNTVNGVQFRFLFLRLPFYSLYTYWMFLLYFFVIYLYKNYIDYLLVRISNLDNVNTHSLLITRVRTRIYITTGK